MKLPNGIDIVSLDKRRARVRLQAPCAAAQITASETLPARLEELMLQASSLWGQQDVNVQQNDNFNFRTVSDVLPRDEDYISVKFRSLSRSIMPGHYLDFTKPGVLEPAVSMLQGATVFPNHEFTRVEKWLGSVSEAVWDPTGEKFGGVPGINATYKIDALVNPRVARGLMMKPPAIHSTSLTVLFEFEYSHPDLAQEYKFWAKRSTGILSG